MVVCLLCSQIVERIYTVLIGDMIIECCEICSLYGEKEG